VAQFEPSLLQILFAAANIASMAAFGADKLMSIKGQRRISESTLISFAFLGPFGAFAGMLLFRHKTRKAKFLLVPAFLIVQFCLIAYISLT